MLPVINLIGKMENRNSVSNVRALREKFELQADENRSRSSALSKYGSQSKLTTQLCSLHLTDSIAPNEEVTRPLTPSSQKIRQSIPLPPSVLPMQVLKPRPFSYSEATGSGSLENEMYNSFVGSPPAPEKPPRTFLYDLLSDPSPRETEVNNSSPHTSNYSSGVSLRRKMPLTSTVSLPRSNQRDLENGNQREIRQSVPVHRKAIYISDGPVGATRRKKKTKTIRSFPFVASSDNSTTGEESEQYGSWNGSDPPHVSINETYLSARKEMTRILDKQSQSAHRISTANIRPIQVSSGNGQAPPPANCYPTELSFTPSSPRRIFRAKTESDILSSVSQRSYKSVLVCDSSDYGSIQDESDQSENRKSSDQLKYNSIHMLNQPPIGVKNYLNPYYYPRGLLVGSDGKLSRQPIPSDHPNHFSIGILQNFQQFFDSEDESLAGSWRSCQGSASAWEKYLDFIRQYHPELEKNQEPALFYRQGTSVTVVPAWQSNCMSRFCSTSPQYPNYSSSSILSPELGIWRNPTIKSTNAAGPRRTTHTSEVLASSVKSKSEWNLNEAIHDRPRRHSTQNFISARAVFLEGIHNNGALQQDNVRNNNGFIPRTALHQSIHSLVNQVYPSIDSVSSKDVTTSSTDSGISGIQLCTDSLSSCDTPLTGDSTTDTGDSDCENDTENLDAMRQVVEERKGYIRRVSSIRTTELLPLQRLLRSRPLPETLPPIEHENERGGIALFDNLLVIGIRRDEKTGAYHPIIKYKFPHSTILPDGIERFCFPDSMEWPCHEGKTAQFYTLTLTQSDGTRKYGCCYRILPDGANICIPIAYCIITKTRAIGFYRKVLQILASRHGYCDAQMSYMINGLYEEEVPDPGKNLLLTDPISMSSSITNSIDYDMAVPIIIRRKADSRLENNDLYLLLTSLDLSISLKLFGSLLLERKIILLSKHLNLLSLSVEALYSMLYPFTWQHTFVPILPLNMIELLELPAPFVIGVLRSQVVPWDIKLDEGIVVDLDQKKILNCVGDEASILPKRLYKKLREALHSVLNLLEQTENTRNVLVSECFIRMFVETVGHYRASGTLENSFYQNSDDATPEMRVFKKEMFLKSVSSKSNRDFLDWFTETSMFQQFIETRKLPDFKPGLFEQRCMEQLELNNGTNLNGNNGNVPWKHPSILSKGTAWIKGAFYKERE